MWLLFLLGSVFLAWLAQALLFHKYWDKGLFVSVRFRDFSVFEGESGTLLEVVTNNKHLPILALSVRLSFSRDLTFERASSENAGVSDQTYKRDIFSLLPMQQITRTLSFTANKRGYYTIKNADVSGYDYFFHKGYYASFPQETHLYVYPRPADTRRIMLLSKALSGMMLSKNKLVTDPFEFSGIRSYQREDSIRHINWRASARAGELMVNKTDATTDYQVTILLDLEDSHILKQEELIEESIRIAAGLAAELLRAKMPVSVRANCVDAFPKDAHPAGSPLSPASPAESGTKRPTARPATAPFSMDIPATSGSLAPLLLAFARMDTQKTLCSAKDLIDAELQAARHADTCILISKNDTAELALQLLPMRKSGVLPMIICPIQNGDSHEEQVHCDIPIIYWEAGGEG